MHLGQLTICTVAYRCQRGGPGQDESGNGRERTVYEVLSAEGACGSALQFDGMVIMFNGYVSEYHHLQSSWCPFVQYADASSE